MDDKLNTVHNSCDYEGKVIIRKDRVMVMKKRKIMIKEFIKEYSMCFVGILSFAIFIEEILHWMMYV